jgi:hypothetical protein
MNRATPRALDGGRQTLGIVRIGDTVHRPLHARSAEVHRLLGHLETVGFDGAPRYLGTDEDGREVLTFLPGEAIHRTPAGLSDTQLVSAAELVRRFHDATSGSALVERDEVVCHGDLGPHNMLFAGDVAVAIIDWDDGVAPGPRLVDFAHAVWCCADVCEPEVDVAEQARKVRVMCAAYGSMEPAAVIDEITDLLRRQPAGTWQTTAPGASRRWMSPWRGWSATPRRSSGSIRRSLDIRRPSAAAYGVATPSNGDEVARGPSERERGSAGV